MYGRGHILNFQIRLHWFLNSEREKYLLWSIDRNSHVWKFSDLTQVSEIPDHSTYLALRSEQF